MIADRLTQFSRRDYPGIDFYLNWPLRIYTFARGEFLALAASGWRRYVGSPVARPTHCTIVVAFRPTD